MECVATVRVLVERAAWWLASRLTGLPIWVPLSKKVTAPPEAVPDWALTVAVNVTDWPEFDGLSDETRLVVVETGAALVLRSRPTRFVAWATMMSGVPLPS